MKKNITEEVMKERWAQLIEGTSSKKNKIETSELIEYKNGVDGRKYGIVKENAHFFIKASNTKKENLDSSDFMYITGLGNILDYRYNSLHEAQRDLNFKLINIEKSFETKFIKESETGKDIKAYSEEPKKIEEDDSEEDLEDVKSDIEDIAQSDEEPTPEPEAEKPEPEEKEVEVSDKEIEKEPVDSEPSDDVADSEEKPEPETDEPKDEEEPDSEEKTEPESDETDSEEESESDFENEILKHIGKAGQLASSHEVSPDFAKRALSQIIGHFSGELKDMDIEDRKELATKIKRGGKSEENEEIGSPFDQYLTEMGLSHKDSTDEMAGAMSSYVTECMLGEKEEDYDGMKKYMNKGISEALVECMDEGMYETFKSKMGEGEYGDISEKEMKDDEKEEINELGVDYAAERTRTPDPDEMFKIKPETAFKIYDIIKKEIPEVQRKFAIKSSFFDFLNDNLESKVEAEEIGDDSTDEIFENVKSNKKRINERVKPKELTKEEKIQKIVQKRLQEKLEGKKSTMNESKNPKLFKVIDRIIEESLKKVRGDKKKD